MDTDIFQQKLQNIYTQLGGYGNLTPPADCLDILNWWMSQIYEALSGNSVQKAPEDIFDDTNWWLQTIFGFLSGNILNPPLDIRDSLEWWFQQFHEFYTGEAGVTAPNPASNLDSLYWWLDTIYNDIMNSGSIPWRFNLSAGELILSGDSLPPSFALNPATGELTVNDADLPAGFTNWRIQDGRLFADEV